MAKFTLLTRPAEQDFATSVHIDGGADMEVSSTGGSAGTTVVVENLFFNVPARRKFLKTAATEGRYISELLTKLALSRPDVRFKLMNNDKEVLHTSGDGDLAGTIRSLYGRNVADELLTVNFSDAAIKISGFIGNPPLLKSSRQWQTLFVNGRSIGNKMLAKAIDHAYQSQIPKSGFPFAVLNITVDTASVDVNVHPQKSEVKFSDESLVYKAMYKALTDALTRPMSAQKTEITLLPDSELNAFVQPKQNLPATFEKAEMLPLKQAAVQPANVLPPLHGSVSSKNTRPAASSLSGSPIFKSAAEPIFKTPEPQQKVFLRKMNIPQAVEKPLSVCTKPERNLVKPTKLLPEILPKMLFSKMLRTLWKLLRKFLIGRLFSLQILTAVLIPFGPLVKWIKPLSLLNRKIPCI